MSISFENAQELQRDWKAKGNLPCDHQNLEKEKERGRDTGDYVCTRCGEARWGKDWNKEK